MACSWSHSEVRCARSEHHYMDVTAIRLYRTEQGGFASIRTACASPGWRRHPVWPLGPASTSLARGRSLLGYARLDSGRAWKRCVNNALAVTPFQPVTVNDRCDRHGGNRQEHSRDAIQLGASQYGDDLRQRM